MPETIDRTADMLDEPLNGEILDVDLLRPALLKFARLRRQMKENLKPDHQIALNLPIGEQNSLEPVPLDEIHRSLDVDRRTFMLRVSREFKGNIEEHALEYSIGAFIVLASGLIYKYKSQK